MKPETPPSVPDGYSQARGTITEDTRRHALACQAVVKLPNSAAAIAFEKVELAARTLVTYLDPARATEAEMRTALAAWKHAREVLAGMQSFVTSVDRHLEAESQSQKAVDKPDETATMAAD